MARYMRSRLYRLSLGRNWNHQAEYKKATGKCLLCHVLSFELGDGRRIVAENPGFVAIVPFYARYPYEIHIMPRSHKSSLPDLDSDERQWLAGILKTVTCGYDHLFGFSFPYMMIMHQAPTSQGDFGHYHFPHRILSALSHCYETEIPGRVWNQAEVRS